MKKVLAVAIISILFFSAFTVLMQATNVQASTTSKPNISIQPTQKAAALGVPFSVDVVVSGIVPEQRVVAMQVLRVLYDSSILKATNVTEGPFMKDSRWAPFGTTFLASIDDDLAIYGGNVLIGVLLNPDSNGVWSAFPNGTGTVATITFQTVSQPKVLPTTAKFTIQNNLILNDNIQVVPSTTTDGVVQIASVALDIQPASVYVALGQSFSVNVVVSGMTPDKRVIGIQFRVKYDSSVLQTTQGDVTEGSFMTDKRWNLHSTEFIVDVQSPGNADDSYGPNVLVGDLLLPDGSGVWNAFPNGTGTVATIKFSTIAHPAYVPTTTALTLVGNLVINDTAPPANSEVPSSVSSANVNIDLPPPAYLYVYPGVSYALVGHPLVVSVLINDLDVAWRATGVQFRLCYDSSLFEVVNVTEGSFMTDKRWNYYGTEFISNVNVDPIYGSNVLIGDLVLPNLDNGTWVAFPHGFGVLATITLNPIHAAGINDPPLMTTLSLQNDLIVNDANGYVGEVLHTLSNATVEILPIQPTLSVNPPLVEAHAVGTIFSVNIDVSELNAGWRAVSAQVRLLYDPTYLEVVNVTEGPFMQDPRWNLHGTVFLSSVEVDPIYGPDVLIGDIVLPNFDNGVWDAFPTGNGTIATVTFNVISQPIGLENPPAHVYLGLGDPFSTMLNDNNDYINTNLLSGEFRVYPTHKADLNVDGKVDMKDIAIVAKAFGTKNGDLRWNAIADVVTDGIINMRDVGTVARNFGWPQAHTS